MQALWHRCRNITDESTEQDNQVTWLRYSTWRYTQTLSWEERSLIGDRGRVGVTISGCWSSASVSCSGSIIPSSYGSAVQIPQHQMETSHLTIPPPPATLFPSPPLTAFLLPLSFPLLLFLFLFSSSCLLLLHCLPFLSLPSSLSFSSCFQHILFITAFLWVHLFHFESILLI